MATYLRPGVFVEETLTALSNPTTDSSGSVAAFVGANGKGGPIGPTLVTSWSQFVSYFGGVQGAVDALPFAVYQFFNNGGSQCYVVRAINETGVVAASATLNDANAVAALTVTATSPGKWASDPASSSRVFVTIETTGTNRFNLVVEIDNNTSSGRLAREQFIDLSLDPTDPRYALAVVNSPTVGSKYVSLADPGTYGTGGGQHLGPAAQVRTPLTGGNDGSGDVAYFDVAADPDADPATPFIAGAVNRLDSIDSILNVNLPGVTDANILNNAIAWAESSGKRFVVIDAPAPAAGADNVAVSTAGISAVAGLNASSYAAVYGPWLYIADPSSTVSGALRLVAPGGGVLGQYARNDVLRGVQKTPAGTGTALSAGTISVYCKFTDSQLDSLNQAGYNVIRNVPGAGICVMGGRTLSPASMPDRYINIRRTLNYLESALVSLTQWAIFENNDDVTRNKVRLGCEQFLTTFWVGGGLAGSVQDQAFYVKCDTDNNTQTSINAGELNVEVGVALETPAEFVVIRIGQFDGGSTVTEG